MARACDMVCVSVVWSVCVSACVGVVCVWCGVGVVCVWRGVGAVCACGACLRAYARVLIK